MTLLDACEEEEQKIRAAKLIKSQDDDAENRSRCDIDADDSLNFVQQH